MMRTIFYVLMVVMAAIFLFPLLAAAAAFGFVGVIFVFQIIAYYVFGVV